MGTPCRATIVRFSSLLVERSELDRATVVVEGGGGLVSVVGGLSLGNRGWTLRASALCRRRRLSVSIIADLVSVPRGAPELEEYDYEVGIAGVPTGRLEVSVHHVCRFGETGYPPISVLARRVVLEIPPA